MASRKCPNCGKMHDTILESREGKQIAEIEKCMPCFIETGFTFEHITDRIHLTDDDLYGKEITITVPVVYQDAQEGH